MNPTIHVYVSTILKAWPGGGYLPWCTCLWVSRAYNACSRPAGGPKNAYAVLYMQLLYVKQCSSWFRWPIPLIGIIKIMQLDIAFERKFERHPVLWKTSTFYLKNFPWRIAEIRPYVHNLVNRPPPPPSGFTMLGDI